MTLALKLVEAKQKSQLHTEEFQVFSDNLDTAVRQDWEGMIIAWEKDRASPDPFLVKSECMWAFSLRILCLTQVIISS